MGTPCGRWHRQSRLPAPRSSLAVTKSHPLSPTPTLHRDARDVIIWIDLTMLFLKANRILEMLTFDELLLVSRHCPI